MRVGQGEQGSSSPDMTSYAIQNNYFFRSYMYNHVFSTLASSSIKKYSRNGLENIKSVQPQWLRKYKNRKYKIRIESHTNKLKN